MKTLKLFVFGLLFIASTQAQISVNLNIPKPPTWAPAKATQAKFYYLPEIDSYYDVPAQRFIYVKQGKWVKAEQLPVRFNGYNLRNGKVVYINDFRGNYPYAFHKKHKVMYNGKVYKSGKVKYAKNEKYDKKYDRKHDKKHDKKHNKKHKDNDDDDEDND